MARNEGANPRPCSGLPSTPQRGCFQTANDSAKGVLNYVFLLDDVPALAMRADDQETDLPLGMEDVCGQPLAAELAVNLLHLVLRTYHLVANIPFRANSCNKNLVLLHLFVNFFIFASK